MSSDTGSVSIEQNTGSVLNYINYYLLQSDIDRYIKPQKFTLIFWAEVIAIVLSLAVFYLPILQQVFGYYFLGPTLTQSDLNTMAIERQLIEKFVDVKNKYRLQCTSSNTLGILNIQTNQVIEALTLTGQVIVNCSALNLP